MCPIRLNPGPDRFPFLLPRGIFIVRRDKKPSAMPVRQHSTMLDPRAGRPTAFRSNTAPCQRELTMPGFISALALAARVLLHSCAGLPARGELRAAE